MKQFILIFSICIIIFSCKKETQAPTTRIDEMVDTTAVLKYSGSFVSGPYGSAMGKAEVYKKGNLFEVKLANFTVSNGPALHVFISKEAMPVNFIDLGSLKSTNGNQIYSVSTMPDFASYKYISIHCVDYNHLFGYALLN